MMSSKLHPFSVAIGIVGRQVLRIPHYLLDLTTFILQALRDWRHESNLFNRATYISLVGQMIFSGVDALPAITVLALASGLSITHQLITTVQVFGTTADVVNLLTQIVALEFGSLLTAIILIGRSGSARNRRGPGADSVREFSSFMTCTIGQVFDVKTSKVRKG